MRIAIIGAGIGGLAAALSLHAAGFDEIRVYERAAQIRGLGVGINLLPHAVRELTELGLADRIAALGTAPGSLAYYNRFGQEIRSEPRGIDAGYRWPQLSVHRGELQLALQHAVRERLGDIVRTGHRLTEVTEREDAATARFATDDGEVEETADVIIGADGKLNDETTLGLAFSHVHTNVSSNNGNDTEVNTNLLSAYGSWEQGPLSVLGSLSFGKGDNESKRYVAGERAKGDYDSTVLSADLSAGYKFPLNENLDLIPTLASRYSKVKIDSFSEKGTDASLHAGSQSLEVFDVGGGFKLQGNYGDFKPNARLMAFHDFAQDNANTTSSFMLGGNTFATTGAPATKWTYEAGVGLEWTQGQYTVGASYDYTHKADFNADTFSITGRYDF